MRYFKIGRVNFDSSRCVIIAEAGVNHNGNMRMEKKSKMEHNMTPIVSWILLKKKTTEN